MRTAFAIRPALQSLLECLPDCLVHLLPSMREDILELLRDAATQKWNSSFAVQSINKAFKSVMRAAFKAFCIGLIAPTTTTKDTSLIRHSQSFKRVSGWPGLAFLPCAHGLVVKERLARQGVTIALLWRCPSQPLTAAGQPAGERTSVRSSSSLLHGFHIAHLH